MDQKQQLILNLEAALLEYVERYGLTERARILLTSFELKKNERKMTSDQIPKAATKVQDNENLK